MHPAARLPYALAGALARAAAALAPAGGGKLRQSLRLRRGVRARFRAWASAHRDGARPLLWVHAPSVGEGLQARPLLELARAERPDVQRVYTFYSPSAVGLARSFAADGLAEYADVLPFDTGRDAAALLDALRPTALVFSKLDVWPVLTARAARAGVRVGLTSATLAEGAGRARAGGRMVVGDAYAALRAVGAIDDADAARLIALGARRERVTVTGDTRYDQAWRRARAVDLSEPSHAPSHAALRALAAARHDAGGARFTLVAGSTWPSDETPLLEAWSTLRRQDPLARLVIAPHEPTAAHLVAVEQWASDARLRVARWSVVAVGQTPMVDADVVLVDRVGMLAELYAAGDAAYVGGAFHAAGLHSVLEPAAFALPVAFGPRHGNSRDAGLLLSAGGGASVTSGRTLAELLRRWRTSDALRHQTGAAARAVVERGLGADRRTWALVAQLLHT